MDEQNIHQFRSLDRIKDMPDLGREIKDTVGIAHTRWATKGEVCISNTHPIAGGWPETTFVAHNGIIENYESLRSYLAERDYVFRTDTDTEVIAHLFDLSAKEHWDNAYPVYSELDVFRAVLKRLKGQYAIALISTQQPDTVFLAANGAPLWVSPKGYAASDIGALAGYATDALPLEFGGIALMHKGRVEFYDGDGRFRQSIPSHEVPDEEAKPRESSEAEPNMLREIREQAQLVLQDPQRLSLPDCSEEQASRVFLYGCGSSHYAAMLGKFYIENILGRVCFAQHATDISESPCLEYGYYIGLSQSGETKDTLNALQEILSYLNRDDYAVITNVHTSTASRLAGKSIMLNAGQEIGVAATKTFTMQAIRLLDLCGYFAGRAELGRAVEDVFRIDLEPIVNTVDEYEHILYLGRGMLYPIACEGALKMKEVAYKHAEAIHASEMKHGPIALIDEETLSIFLVAKQDEEQLAKILNNADEILARKGRIVAVCDEASEEAMRKRTKSLAVVRNVDVYLQPLLINVVLQLLAYHVGMKNGYSVDTPRNLAKSCTVE